MKSNENSIDRIIRIVLGVLIGIAIAAKVVTGTVALVAGIAGGILLIIRQSRKSEILEPKTAQV